ncbi:hypothetical protein MRB53_027647 [Persea americana]|uniref:Uncharacterized protein n=1 Tax=Persea americana TaxID=3435 RepID=A0ACC2LMP8_PERAE|nr:hypothetical protein MRB53_027647 [Persea americana]
MYYSSSSSSPSSWILRLIQFMVLLAISGAYCGPINPGGRCYLPNTLQYHASYAFNSYYQSKSMGPGSCGFSPAAAVVSTDPRLKMSMDVF